MRGGVFGLGGSPSFLPRLLRAFLSGSGFRYSERYHSKSALLGEPARCSIDHSRTSVEAVESTIVRR